MWQRCALALALVLFAYALQAAVWESVPPSPTLLFYPAVFVIAWWLGRLPAVVATALSAVGILFSFVEPLGSFHWPSLVRDAIDIALFCLVSVVATIALGRLRESLENERSARRNAETANHAKDEILAIVSHDLRGPINTITLTAELILKEQAATAVHAHAERIHRAARASAALVEDVLAFARVDAGEFALDLKPHSVRDLIAEACDAAAPTADRRKVTLDCEVHDVTALCDRARVLQVLGNLLANALKFTPEGGQVTLRAERIGEQIGIEVRDTGPGVPPELRDRIFERYFTRDRERGAGLGLHISRMLVHAHHGEIGVDSESGRGATFWFTLPVADASAVGATADAEERSEATVDGHVLMGRV